MTKKALYVISLTFLLSACSEKKDTLPPQTIVSTNTTSSTSSNTSTISTSTTSTTSSSSIFIPNNYKGFILFGGDSFSLIASVCDVNPANAPYYRMTSYTCDTCSDFIELIIKTTGLPQNIDYYIADYTNTDSNFKGRITCSFNGSIFNSVKSGVIHFSNTQGIKTAAFENTRFMRGNDQSLLISASGTLICE